MQIPKAFAHDLAVVRRWDVEIGRSQYDKHGIDPRNAEWHYTQLFRTHKTFIQRLCKFALRFELWGLISDEDDLFQEACQKIIRYVRQWNPDHVSVTGNKSRPLEQYVVYNVGADLSKIPQSEITKRKRPETIPYSLQEQKKYHGKQVPLDLSTDNGPASSSVLQTSYYINRDEERAIAIHRAVERIRGEYPLIYGMLLDAIVEDGTVLGAVKNIRHRIRGIDQQTTREYAETVYETLIPKLQSALRKELADEGVYVPE